MSDCIDRFTLTRWVFNDLTPEEMDRVAAHVDRCEICAADADAIKTTACPEAGSGEAHFPGVRARFATLRHRSRSGRMQGYWLPVGVAVAVAALVTIAGSIFYKEKDAVPSREPEAVPASSVGDLACNAYVIRGDEQQRVGNGSLLGPLDRLRFVLFADAPGFVTVFSVDSAGTLAPLYPASSPEDHPHPLAIGQAGSVALPGVRSLTPSPGEVVVVVVLTGKAFDRRVVHARLSGFVEDRQFDAMQREVHRMSGKMKAFLFSKVSR